MAEEQVDREAIRQEMDEMLHGGQRTQAGPAQAARPGQFQTNQYSRVRHVVGVMSGKGGVGKSLVCGILAVGLARKGARVGILDADVTGPSIPRMFGLADERAHATGDALIPATTEGGIEVMSANLVLEHETDPVVWRGPVISGAIRQFFEETAWGELDFLLVDMPPGTGDVALTAFQSLPLDGVVIVSSPQDLVQMVVAKAVNMAAMMDVAVLGLVENMAYLTCPHCGKRVEPFGPSRAKETAEAYGIGLLGQLPIEPALSEAADTGTFETAVPVGMLDEAVETIVATAEFTDSLLGED